MTLRKQTRRSEGQAQLRVPCSTSLAAGNEGPTSTGTLVAPSLFHCPSHFTNIVSLSRFCALAQQAEHGLSFHLTNRHPCSVGVVIVTCSWPQRIDWKFVSCWRRPMGRLVWRVGRLRCSDTLLCRVHPARRDQCAGSCGNGLKGLRCECLTKLRGWLVIHAYANMRKFYIFIYVDL